MHVSAKLGESMMRILQELLPRRLSHSLREAFLIRKATVRNESFYCRALAGESDYNISINSDMTVSCNCQDFDGLGRIGDLNLHSLEEIFSGSTACKFRSMLASKKFPTPICARCADLKFMPAEEVNASLSRYRVPYRGIQVENTAHCNLRCNMCNREKILGLRSGKHSLSLSDVEKIARLLKEYGLEFIHYFNLGEPFLSPDIREQIQIIRKYNPDIRISTSTNGQLLYGNSKIEAALSMDYIGISLDGVTQDAVSKYQIGASFEKAYQNMAKLTSERNKNNRNTPIIEWTYVLFRWNDHPKHISKAIELAKKAHVDLIGFYHGGGRLLDISTRWHYHPYFKQLGKKTNGRILINLNNIPPHLLCP